MDLQLKGKVALITGGSRGMGRATAITLAEEGCDVAVNYVKHKDAVEEVVKKIKEMGRKAISIQADVANMNQVEEMVEKVLKEFGTIDIWVHSAGMGYYGDQSLEVWDQVVKNHLYGTHYVARKVVPIMKEKKSGKIVVFGSIAAHSGNSPYCVSMSAKICYAKGLAATLAPFNINVNTVSPGSIFTDMISPYIPEGEKRKKFVQEGIPLYKNRDDFPTAQEVADVVVFLVSEKSRHITGADIPVNGGQSI